MKKTILIPLGATSNVVNSSKSILSTINGQEDKEIIIPDLNVGFLDDIYQGFEGQQASDFIEREDRLMLDIIDEADLVIFVCNLSHTLTGNASLYARYAMECNGKDIHVYDVGYNSWKPPQFFEFGPHTHDMKVSENLDFDLLEVGEYMGKLLESYDQWPPEDDVVPHIGRFEFDFNEDHGKRIMYFLEDGAWTLAEYDDEQYPVFDFPLGTFGVYKDGEIQPRVPKGAFGDASERAHEVA